MVYAYLRWLGAHGMWTRGPAGWHARTMWTTRAHVRTMGSHHAWWWTTRSSRWTKLLGHGVLKASHSALELSYLNKNRELVYPS